MPSKFCSLLWCGVVVSALLGCGPGEQPFTDNSKDSAAFAKSIKTLVLSTAASVKTSPDPADSLRTVVTALSELDTAPTGEYLQTYNELHVLTKDLLEKSEKRKPADFQSKLNEITKLAETLPGEVVIIKESVEE